MATVTTEAISAAVPVAAGTYETIDDLVERFDVDPERIVLNPLPFTASESDLLDWNDHHDRRAELVDRTLILKALMAVFESGVASALIMMLGQWLRTNVKDGVRLGKVFDSTAIDRMSGGNARLPDVAVILRDSLLTVYRDGVVKTEPRVFPKSPEFVVEVLSRSNRRGEIVQKRSEYFASGTRLMWVVDPRKQTVEVWTGTDAPDAVLNRSDTLTGGDLLPGFELSIDDWFTEAETI